MPCVLRNRLWDRQFQKKYPFACRRKLLLLVLWCPGGSVNNCMGCASKMHQIPIVVVPGANGS